MPTSVLKSLLPLPVTDSNTSDAVISVQTFENSRGAHAAADAHRHHSVAAVAAPQFAQDAGSEFCSGAAQRVAQRDRAAVHVHLFGIETECLDHCQRLRGK